VLEIDPLHEEAHRGLMRLYAAAGTPERAVRQYRLLTRLLRANLELDPAEATDRLYAEIAHAPPPSR
jgi:DNA-binding SARP family transcriptional activator